MNLSNLPARFQGRFQRTVSALSFRRQFQMRNQTPFISFTFDDFPCSAFRAGGLILKKAGVRGTFYASLGLMGTEAPSGKIFLLNDLRDAAAEGHEIGCHTYAHCDSWKTAPATFEESIVQNQRALAGAVSGAAFKTFSYPISWPRPRTKRRVGRHFTCCRCGGQTFNSGIVDLNSLKAFFLEKSADNIGPIKSLIDENRQQRGWLIFATYDIAEQPTRYGCTPSFFEQVVAYSVTSGARILPVIEAWQAICDSARMPPQPV